MRIEARRGELVRRSENLRGRACGAMPREVGEILRNSAEVTVSAFFQLVASVVEAVARLFGILK